MDDLLNSITQLVAEIHPSRIRQLATLIQKSEGVDVTALIQRISITLNAQEQLNAVLTAWKSSGISSSELSGILLGASYAYHQAKSEQSVELVWTGPSSEMVATRKTEQALLEVINAAVTDLFITSFVAYKVDSVINALKKSVERNVSVSILLESSEQYGGGVSIDSIKKMSESVPEAKIYYWKQRGREFVGAKVHAKVAVADHDLCFISSANLTGHAMEKNMEAGVLIRGGELPGNLMQHLHALVTTSIIVCSVPN